MGDMTSYILLCQ